MPPESSSPLAFLLSLASLPIVGCGDDGVPADDTGSASTGDETTASTSAPDDGDDDTTAGASVGSTGQNEGSTTGADTTGGPMDGSTTGDTTATSDDTDTGDGTESGSTATEDTGAPVGLCEMFGEHLAKCSGGRSIFYTMYCETTLGIPEYPDDCIAAWEDYFACIVATSCADLEMEGFCADEIEARELACAG